MFAFRAILMIPIFVYIFTQMLSVPPPHNSAIVVAVYLAWTREFYFDNFLYHFQRSTLYARTTSIYFCMEISKWLCRCACSPVFGQRSRLRLFWRVWNAHLARYHAVSCRRSSPPASSSPKRHRSLALNKNTLLSVVFNGVFFFVWHFGVKRRWHTHSSCIGSTCATSQTVITSSLPAAKQSKHISQMAAESFSSPFQEEWVRRSGSDVDIYIYALAMGRRV